MLAGTRPGRPTPNDAGASLALPVGSIINLDRAAEPAAVLGAQTFGLNDAVAILRRQTCEMLRALADGQRGSGQQTHEIDEALKRLRAVLEEDDPRSRHHQTRSALAFRLHEVRKTVSDLADLCRKQG